MPSPRTLIREFTARPDARRSLELLNKLAGMPLSARDLHAVHELLLFHKAYPLSEEMYDFCAKTLALLPKRIQQFDEESLAELDQSGMAGTRIFYPYDYETTRWLQKRLKYRVDVDWEAYEDRDDDPLADALPKLISRAEGDVLDTESLSTQDFVRAACAPGKQTTLAWILDGFARAFGAGMRETLYNEMQLMLSVTLEKSGPSRTLLDDGRPERVFVWEPQAARAPFDLVKEATRPLELPPPLDEKRGRALLDLALGTLLPRLRELYPLTHANPAEVYDIALERGIRIVVWFMVPEFRLPLEAGWGLLLLKNNVPIGYGAGGMLGQRSEIAINVFDTFRGGEAAWLYSQYARVFHAFCRAPWLVTRRYQVGYENEEGIASGAYWFWDKLGFRSVDKDIRKLADVERKKIARVKGYRTPRRELKKLAEADVAFSLEGTNVADYSEYPLGKVGLLATRTIAKRFGGERKGLEARALRALADAYGVSTVNFSSAEKSALAQMGLLILAIPDFGSWTTQERARVFELARLKGSAHEADYARAMAGNGRFFGALTKLAE